MIKSAQNNSKKEGKNMKRKIKLQTMVIILFITMITISVNGKFLYKVKANSSGYTVEFTYKDKEYVMNGDSTVKLSDILDYLKIFGSVEKWEVSNTKLFDIYLGKDDGIVYKSIDKASVPTNNGTIPWLLAKKAFDTTEWLKVIVDGKKYKIIVTDDNTEHNVPGPYSRNISTNNDDNFAITGDNYFLNASKPNNVLQSQSTTSATDFAAGLPLSTIFIDVDKIGNSDKTDIQGEFTLLTDNQAIRGGFEHLHSDTLVDVVRYNPMLDTENLMQIKPNIINVLEGELFQFIYKDAAILSDGSRAHLKIVYSNAKIAIDQRLGVTDTSTGLVPSNYQGAISLARGASITRGGTDMRYLGTKDNVPNSNYTNPFSTAQRKAMAEAVNTTLSANWDNTFTNSNANTADNPSVGQSIDVTYQVVDDEGKPINGTFIFAVTGINLDRDPYAITGNNVCKPIWSYTIDHPELHFFSEAMSVNKGKISDYIYVRPNTPIFESSKLEQEANGTSLKHSYFYSQVIKDENGNPKFIGNSFENTHGGNDRSYNSGFVLLGDAAEGITITATGHASGKTSMNTHAYGGKIIWHRYTSSTGAGGSIQTTSEGNYGGTLDDKSDNGTKSDVLDQGIYVVPEGKTITYTMTPDNKYRIKKLEIKGADGSIQEIKYNGDELYKMSNGDTVAVIDAAGNTATLTAKANGVFTLEIPYAESEEDIYVEWEKYIGNLTIRKETTSDKSGSFDFRIKVWQTDDTTTLLDLSALFCQPNSQGYYSFTLPNNENIGIQIPYGYSYEVYENTQVGWRLKNINGDEEKTKATGSIVSSNDDITETFLNELVTFDLTIKKIVTGNMGDLDKKFDFTVKIINRENTAINGTYKVVKNGIEETADIPNDGYVFKLKHNETFVIKDIEESYSYVITETDTEYIEQYKITKTDDNSVITAQRSGLKAEGTLSDNQIVEFVNNKDKQTTIEEDVPQTEDKMMSYIIMLILSIIGLVSSTIYRKRNNLVKK